MDLTFNNLTFCKESQNICFMFMHEHIYTEVSVSFILMLSLLMPSFLPSALSFMAYLTFCSLHT